VSKLSERFAAGKEALAAQKKVIASDAKSRLTASFVPARASGPLHGSVTTMKMDMMRSELDALRSANPVVKLHPGEIRASVWANRHPDSFKTDEFESLKQEIKSAKGNIQPIKVRVLSPDEAQGGFKYEIAYGHRRHRACYELGLDVAAMIEEMSPTELFVQMDRENRERANLRPYEQGLMYARALDGGLFSSLRKLAEETGVDPTNASKAIALARLPNAVLECFVSPLDIQYRWASDLRHLLDKEPELLFARVADIKKAQSAGRSLSSQDALEMLVGRSVTTKKSSSRKVVVGQKVLTIIEENKKVSYVIDTLGSERQAKIEKFIMEMMSG